MSGKFENPAILFGGESITGLGVLRNLGKNGVAIYYVAERKSEVIFSKYCKGYFIIPRIEHDKEVLKNFFEKFENKLNNYAVVFPGSDLFCLNLSLFKSENYHILLPNREIVEILVNKKKFYQSLAKQNIPHPITHFPESVKDIKNIRKKVSYPAYVRPVISQVFAEKFRKKGFVARSETEMIRYCKLASKYKVDVMIQEIIPGPAVNMFGVNGYFDKNFNPRGLFVYRRLRELPHMFGNGSLIESFSISDASSIRDITVNYLHNLKYHGLADAEFKKDPRDGVLKFLEVNARCWWQNAFPTKCGINLVFMAYLDAIAKKTDYSENYEVGVKWMYFLNDLLSSMKMFKNKQITLKQWLSSLYRTRDWAFFSEDDPVPWIVNPLFTLYSLKNKYRAYKSTVGKFN